MTKRSPARIKRWLKNRPFHVRWVDMGRYTHFALVWGNKPQRNT